MREMIQFLITAVGLLLAGCSPSHSSPFKVELDGRPRVIHVDARSHVYVDLDGCEKTAPLIRVIITSFDRNLAQDQSELKYVLRSALSNIRKIENHRCIGKRDISVAGVINMAGAEVADFRAKLKYFTFQLHEVLSVFSLRRAGELPRTKFVDFITTWFSGAYTSQGAKKKYGNDTYLDLFFEIGEEKLVARWANVTDTQKLTRDLISAEPVDESESKQHDFVARLLALRATKPKTRPRLSGSGPEQMREFLNALDAYNSTTPRMNFSSDVAGNLAKFNSSEKCFGIIRGVAALSSAGKPQGHVEKLYEDQVACLLRSRELDKFAAIHELLLAIANKGWAFDGKNLVIDGSTQGPNREQLEAAANRLLASRLERVPGWRCDAVWCNASEAIAGMQVQYRWVVETKPEPRCKAISDVTWKCNFSIRHNVKGGSPSWAGRRWGSATVAAPVMGLFNNMFGVGSNKVETELVYNGVWTFRNGRVIAQPGGQDIRW